MQNLVGANLQVTKFMKMLGLALMVGLLSLTVRATGATNEECGKLIAKITFILEIQKSCSYEISEDIIDGLFLCSAQVGDRQLSLSVVQGQLWGAKYRENHTKTLCRDARRDFKSAIR